MKVIDYLINKKLVEVIETDEDIIGKVTFDKSKGNCVIYINKDIKEPYRSYVLLHELAHIIREDIFINTQIFDLEIANIAQDCIINEIINLKKIIVNDKEIIPVTYEGLKKIIENLPDWKEGWIKLYEVILNSNKNKEIEFNFKDIEYIDKEDISKEDLEKIRQNIKNIRKEILKNVPEEVLPDNEKEDLEKLQDIIKNFFENKIENINKFASSKGSKEDFVIQEKKSNPIIKKLIKHLPLTTGKQKKIRRTFRREGIVPNFGKFMELPALDITFIVDVSGSYINVSQSKVLPVILWLSKDYFIRLILFDDYAKEVKLSNRIKFKGSGGTSYFPIIKLLKDKKWSSNLIVFISDFEFFDLDYNLSIEERKEMVKKDLLKFANKIITIDWKEFE